jgi:hypothetical protein
MKPTKIRVWPELTDYVPALPVLTDERRRHGNSIASIELDFGAVREVTSTGLAVFLLQLARLVGPDRVATIRHDASEPIRARLEQLGALAFLSAERPSNQADLFANSSLVTGSSSMHPAVVHSLPLYDLRFPAIGNRRDTVRTFLSYLQHAMSSVASLTQLDSNGIIMLLNEIAKNTADHAGANAVFGMDVFVRSDSSHRVSFAYGDLGMGIKQHIQQNLSSEEAKRLRHMSLYEAYRLALKPGYTSNRLTKVNKGHGMSIIIEIASTLGMHLSVFDAWSRGMLTALPDLQAPTHAVLRRVFRTVGHDVGFFYFGEMTLAHI